MEKTDLIEKLSSLAQLDVDAVRAYGVAIDKIADAEIKETLESFKKDHQRHVEELNAAIVQLGGNAVEDKEDLKGLLMKGMTLIRSAMGTESALKAMRTNEEKTNEVYDDALEDNNFPPDIKALIIKNRDDERKHLAYVESRLIAYAEQD